MSENEHLATPPTPSLFSEDQIHLICSVCLDMFNDPRMLACHHTFCETCIEKLLVSSHADFVQCPQCRKRTRLTLEEVPLLQANFYLTPLLEEAQDPDKCDSHRKEKLRFICRYCDEAVCCECILKEHRRHDLKDFRKAKEDIRAHLTDGVEQFANVLTELNTKLEGVRRWRQIAEDERKVVKYVLTKKAKELHAIIDGLLEKALISAKRMMDPIANNERVLEEKVALVQYLQADLQETLAKKASYKDLMTARSDLQRNKESVLNEEAICEAERLERESHLCGLPALKCDNSLPRAKMIASLLGQVFMGTSLAHTMVLHRAFQSCSGRATTDNNVLVHALCVGEDGCVWVAYGLPATKGKGCVARFSSTGDVLSKPFAIKGRVCLAGFPSGQIIVEGKYSKEILTETGLSDLTPGLRNLRCNAYRLYDVYNKLEAKYLLWLHPSLQCELMSVVLPACGKCGKVLVQAPVAMDASQDGKLFAMVEGRENQVPLYHLDKGSKPFSVFRGKYGEPFEPLDICFYVIEGEERLVVADGASKSLMVLKVDDDSGCEIVDEMRVTPSDSSGELYKPTALCPDRQGQLWVGCRGGQILCMAPRNPSSPPNTQAPPPNPSPPQYPSPPKTPSPRRL